jgi:DNA-binding NarL/FixJ family response regulator
MRELRGRTRRGAGADWKPGKGAKGGERPGVLGPVVSLVLVDDEATVRQAVAHIIHEKYNAEVLEADCAAQAVRLCQSKYPTLVLLGILLPGLDSFSAALEIRQLRPHAKIAILTRHALPDQMLRARRLHLNGFILKRDDSEELFYAIKTILGGGFYAPPSMSNLLRDQVEITDALSMLTQREKSVLALYAQGPASRRIGPFG